MKPKGPVLDGQKGKKKKKLEIAVLVKWPRALIACRALRGTRVGRVVWFHLGCPYPGAPMEAGALRGGHYRYMQELDQLEAHEPMEVP